MPTLIGKTVVLNRVYNPDALSWEAMVQPSTGGAGAGSTSVSVTNWPALATESGNIATIKGNTDLRALTTASGSVSGLGNNTLITPASGKRIRLSYASYNPALAVEAGFRFGAAGALFLRNSVSAGAVVAKDFGDMRYVQGAVDESLVLNLSVGVATIWNAFYQEV